MFFYRRLTLCADGSAKFECAQLRISPAEMSRHAPATSSRFLGTSALFTQADCTRRLDTAQLKFVAACSPLSRRETHFCLGYIALGEFNVIEQQCERRISLKENLKKVERSCGNEPEKREERSERHCVEPSNAHESR